MNSKAQQIQNEMTMRVLKVISDRTIENPITGEGIAQMVGSEWRMVARSVETLRFLGFKIGSSKTKPMGYFLARSPEEMRPTAERMKRTCLVQLKQVQRMYMWSGNQPTIFDGHDLAEVDDAIQEFQRTTGEVLS